MKTLGIKELVALERENQQLRQAVHVAVKSMRSVLEDNDSICRDVANDIANDLEKPLKN